MTTKGVLCTRIKTNTASLRLHASITKFSRMGGSRIHPLVPYHRSSHKATKQPAAVMATTSTAAPAKNQSSNSQDFKSCQSWYLIRGRDVTQSPFVDMGIRRRGCGDGRLLGMLKGFLVVGGFAGDFKRRCVEDALGRLEASDGISGFQRRNPSHLSLQPLQRFPCTR